MKNNYLLRNYLKLSKPNAGFTLLELLVAIIIGTSIVATLLSFLVGVLDTDRKEQVKVNTQEELQAAIDYIADDVKEAIYIYDADGINQVSNLTTIPLDPLQSGIKNQLPFQGDTTKVPILVFWKRFYYPRDEKITTFGGGLVRRVSCLRDVRPTVQPSPPPNPPISLGCTIDSDKGYGPDEYVYSLVAYYLVKGTSGDSTWSSSARIIRWELKDGIRAGRCTSNAGSPNCDWTNLGVDGKRYYLAPDAGFKRFIGDTADQRIQPKNELFKIMNFWTKTNENFNFNANPTQVLVDFIDDTPSNLSISGTPVNPTVTDCTGDGGIKLPGGSQRIPAAPPPYSDTASYSNNAANLSSFYVCVNAKGSPSAIPVVDPPSRPIVKIFLRGNALARLNDKYSTRQLATANTAFIPTSSITVVGRGFVNTSPDD